MINCIDCIHYEASDSTCRVNPPDPVWSSSSHGGSHQWTATWPLVVPDKRGCGKGERIAVEPSTEEESHPFDEQHYRTGRH